MKKLIVAGVLLGTCTYISNPKAFYSQMNK
jgi:hypothetical protein